MPSEGKRRAGKGAGKKGKKKQRTLSVASAKYPLTDQADDVVYSDADKDATSGADSRRVSKRRMWR